MKSQNLSKLKNMKKSIIQLFSYSVIMLLSICAMAQNPYIIYNYGTTFPVFHNSLPVGIYDKLQDGIYAIREKAAGADCTIQFGNPDVSGGEVLNMGGGTYTLIYFSNSATQKWGKITLTGKATTACETVNGVIKIEDPVSIECKAEITATGSGHMNNSLLCNYSTLTISGGIISSKRVTIWNYSGTVNISGGEVLANDYSNNTYSKAIFNYENGILNITGGKVLAKEQMNVAILNDGGTVNISGGTVSATGKDSYAVNNWAGTVTISNGIISATGEWSRGVCNWDSGTTIITGGDISATTGAAVTNWADWGKSIHGNRMLPFPSIKTASNMKSEEGLLTISGGKVSATSGTAVNNSLGKTTIISGGEISATTGIAVINDSYSKINISGTAKITSANESLNRGTIYLHSEGPSTDDCCLEITGGTIDNTAAGEKNIIYNYSPGEVKISGGTVELKGAGGVAINNANTGKITINGGTVAMNATTGTAINNQSTGTINISNGSVTSKQGTINNKSTGTINISGGTVEGTGTSASTVISNKDNGAINISGGTVKATKGKAIENFLKGKITISGTAKVTSAHVDVDFGTIYLSNPGTITNCFLEINGGIVENTATTGNAIYNFSTGEVKISGGMILAKEGYAISNNGAGTANFSGGIAFAYGKKTDDVITGTTQSDNAVIVAWDKTAGNNTYEAYTDKDIFKNPTAATAVWTKQGDMGGIMAMYNTTAGFIPVEGVTITGMGINETENNDVVRVYPNPTTGEIRFEISDMRYEILEIEIFDVFGRNIVSNLKSQISNQKIDISHLPTGVYFVKITTDNGVITKKIIKSEL